MSSETEQSSTVSIVDRAKVNSSCLVPMCVSYLVESEKGLRTIQRKTLTGMRTRLASVDSSPVAAVSAAATVTLAPVASTRFTKKRTRRQCSNADCKKVDAGGGFCVAHGGGKKCSYPGCAKGYQTGGFCRRHGGGARCQVEGCAKVDAGRGLCRAHGGGKRCQVADCPKADVGGGFCTAHGGGRRCSEPGCSKIDQGGGKCRAHGGARRCRRRNCQQPARGVTGFCTDHGGSHVCSVLTCRRLVRSPSDTGTLCATCARIVKQRAKTEIARGKNSDHCDDSPRNSAISTPEGAGTAVLSPTSANARCDGSQIANCLENGCSRSFGGDCNCVEDCSCNSPTSLSTSRMVPLLTSSNTITTVASSSNQTISPSGISDFRRLRSSTLTPTLLQRYLLQIKPCSSVWGIEAVVAMLTTVVGVKSVHVVPSSTTRSSSAAPASERGIRSPYSSRDVSPSSLLVVVRGGQSLDLEPSLASLRNLNLAQIDIIEQTTTAWTRKEVVLHVPDMMCPGNCGSSVLNALRIVEGVEAVRLRFEQRQVAIRGDMNTSDLVTAVMDIGFEPEVHAETPLPRRFRFRVDDLCDMGLSGKRLKNALEMVEGVENIVLLTDRVEVLVVAMLLNSTPLVEAAENVGLEMLELSEEAWGIPMEVVSPTLSANDAEANASAGENKYHQPHTCDMQICPQNGCPRYMTTVAHTAALAVGWAVPGCGMSVGGECTCGDSCKCEGCPEHNPAS